jgi:hypothetical protein
VSFFLAARSSSSRETSADSIAASEIPSGVTSVKSGTINGRRNMALLPSPLAACSRSNSARQSATSAFCALRSAVTRTSRSLTSARCSTRLLDAEANDMVFMTV